MLYFGTAGLTPAVRHLDKRFKAFDATCIDFYCKQVSILDIIDIHGT